MLEKFRFWFISDQYNPTILVYKLKYRVSGVSGAYISLSIKHMRQKERMRDLTDRNFFD
jgi:hypothetical protein